MPTLTSPPRTNKQSSAPVVATYDLGTLARDPDGLDSLEDPNGYLRGGIRQWASTLLSNPIAEASDPALTVAHTNRRVVGRLGYVPAMIREADKLERALALDGFFVDESHRATGIGASMMMAAIETRRTLLASGGPSPAALRLYSRLGFQEAGPLRRFLCFNQASPITDRVLKNPSASRATSLLLQPAFATYRTLMSRLLRARGPFEVATSEGFPAEVDPTQINACGYPVSAQQWNWVAKHRQLHFFQVEQSGVPVAWALAGASALRLAGDQGPEHRCLRLLDYQVEERSSEALKPLLVELLRFAARGNFAILEMQVANDALAQLLSRYRFFERGGNCTMRRRAGHLREPIPEGWRVRCSAGDVYYNF